MNFLPIPSLAYFLLVWKMKPSELHMDVCLAWNAFLSCWTWQDQDPCSSGSSLCLAQWFIRPSASSPRHSWLIPGGLCYLLGLTGPCWSQWKNASFLEWAVCWKWRFEPQSVLFQSSLKKKKILKKILQNRTVFMLFFSLALIAFDWAIALQFCEK